MKYPNFDSDILFASDTKAFQLFVQTLLTDKLLDSGISVESQELQKDELISKDEWLTNTSIINIFINQSLLDQYGKNEQFPLLYDGLKEVIKPLTKMTPVIYNDANLPKSKPFALMTLFYKTSDELIFKFLFDIEGDEILYVNMIDLAFRKIVEYNEEGNHELKKAVQNSFTQSHIVKYFIFSENSWNVLNPLIEIGKKINHDYRHERDGRIRKPRILMQRDNFSKYIILDSNWVLEFDGLETMLIQPNDVSLYASLSHKNLQQAIEFYNEVIIPRHKNYGGAFPPLKIQRQYYDYFELIISSIIFSYTCIEAFANICIPSNYEYVESKAGIKTIFSKEAIERRFSLKDKFKNVLSQILITPDVSREKWWPSFIKLEEIRNEIIHSKESKSEERYSKLLSKEIFEVVKVNVEIVSYYGIYISNNNQRLLNSFPYDFGYDEFYPNLTDSESFERSVRILRGNN